MSSIYSTKNKPGRTIHIVRHILTGVRAYKLVVVSINTTIYSVWIPAPERRGYRGTVCCVDRWRYAYALVNVVSIYLRIYTKI